VFPLLAAIAPSIVQYVGSQLRGKSKVIDEGLNVVQQALGKPVNSLADAEYMMKNATPEQIAALKAGDLDFYKNYNQMIVALVNAEVEDRRNAQLNQQQTQSFMPQIIVAVLSIGLFYIFYLLFNDATNLNIEEKDIIYLIIGTYIGKWADSISFFMGSSFGSRAKDFIGGNKG
jgi:hypothetical protein